MSIKEEIKEEEVNETANAVVTEFFSMLLGSKLVAHILHFQVTGEGSYAAHIALDEFYNSANEIADKIIEVYQGNKKTLVKFDLETLTYGIGMKPIEYLKVLREVIQDGRSNDALKDSNIQNEIDNFISLIDQTVYKLAFLK